LGNEQLFYAADCERWADVADAENASAACS